VRQYKTHYFLFFLLIAVTDPINLATRIFFKADLAGFIFPFMTGLMVLSLIDKLVIKRNKLTVVLYLLIIISISYFFRKPIIYASIIVFNELIIIFIVLKDFIVNFVDHKTINLFLLMLFFYLSTALLKMFNFLTGFADAAAFFYITSFFQILFGLFFTVFREDNPKIVIQF